MVDDRRDSAAQSGAVPGVTAGPSTAHLGVSTDREGDGDEEPESVGTLVIFPSGRAKFLGRTAATEWLKNVDNSVAYVG